MSPDDHTAVVLELLDKRIESLEQLEILLFLRKGRERSWTAQELGEHLRHCGQISEALVALRAAGLVQPATPSGPGQYVYSPASPQLDAAVTELARQYREEPIPIMRILSANSIRRMRTGAARAFADAFVIRKREDDEHG